MKLRGFALVLAAAASLPLAACHRGDSTASARAGNRTEHVAPAADTAGASGGGSSGEKGGMGTANASGGANTPHGATGTGSGTQAMGGPASGLAGGMAPAGSAGQSTGVAEGSTNRTSKSSVGNR